MLDNDNEHDVHESIITKEIWIMKTKTCGLDRFFLNLSYAIVEFIAGGILDPALSLRIPSMTWDAIAIGISAFWKHF